MKKLTTISICSGGVLLAVFSVATAASSSGSYKLVGWNDLGMHCVDGNDYSVFSILPPYNNVHAQLIDPNGKLVKSPSGIRLTYEAVADPSGSINRTSVGKTNFWQFVKPLFGVSLAPDMGLAGKAMPGASNTPQAMSWDLAKYEFVAQGVPITPYPDNPPSPGAKNYYPLMRLVARNSSNKVLATADVVLPVSDEMACSTCHASGSTAPGALPSKLAHNPDPNKDYKLNILQLHDDRHGTQLMARQPVLCASCHGSNALGTTGSAKPLTQVLHTKHATVIETGAAATREACYNCHPGSATKCLRGAMGNAGMQCQNCHGSMAQVGASTRRGWLDEPGCENCHTGTAVKNSGQILYTDAFAYPGGPLRQAADPRFAVNTGKLYRLSTGHGKLACEACHGSTHAEYPSSHTNDNLMVTRLQGHSGTLVECTTCHTSNMEGQTGPHGMHPTGAWWADKHHDAVEKQGTAACRDCHGGDLRGTVLSAALTDRTIDMGEHGVKTFTKGTVIGCWSCHNGPNP